MNWFRSAVTYKLAWQGRGLWIYKGKVGKRIFVTVVEAKGTVRGADPRLLTQLAQVESGTIKRFPNTRLAHLLGGEIRQIRQHFAAQVASSDRHSREFGELIKRIGDADWVLLLKKATFVYRKVDSPSGAHSGIKGLAQEIDLRWVFNEKTRTPEAQALIDEMEASIRSSPDSVRWSPNVFIFQRAYAYGKKGGGELGDLVFVAFDDPKQPSRMWVLGTANSKSAGNANELLSYGSIIKPDGSVIEGEWLGQPDLDLERLMELGIDIPGIGQFSLPGTPRSAGDAGGAAGELKVNRKSFLRIGIIPPDTKQGVANQLGNLAAKDKTFRLLRSRLADRDASSFADEVLTYIGVPK